MAQLPAAARNARKTLYDGRLYRSGWEAEVAMQLDVRQRAGEIEGWIYEPTVTVRWPGTNQVIGRFKPDFLVTYPNGRQEYIEAKGYARPGYALVRKLIEAATGLPVIVIWDDRRRP